MCPRRDPRTDEVAPDVVVLVAPGRDEERERVVNRTGPRRERTMDGLRVLDPRLGALSSPGR